MRSFAVAGLIGALVCTLLTPLVRKLALRVGALSPPGGRHIHHAPTPRLGGLAILMAFFAPLIGLYFVESAVAAMVRAETRKVIGLAAGGLLVSAVGAIDDIRHVRPLYKVAVQFIAAVIAFWAGFRIEGVLLPFAGELNMGSFAPVVTALWIVGITNAVNLIDGLDGLAAGVVLFASLTNFIVGAIAGGDFVCLMMATMFGVLVAFLRYNAHPARIFMGDSGSYFLGYVLALTSLVGASQKASTTIALLTPILAMGVPIFDTLFTITRRYLERRPIFSADRGHIHHRLLDMGITHKRAVHILYGISVVFTGLGIAISLGRSWEVGLSLLIATALIVGLMKYVGYFEQLRPALQGGAPLQHAHLKRLRLVMPALPSRLSAAESEQALWDRLCELGNELQFDQIDIVKLDLADNESGTPKSLYRWERYPKASRLSDTMIHACFCLGEEQTATHEIRFAWESAGSELSPQMEILLLVLTDMLSTELSRLNSALIPQSGPIQANILPIQQ